MPNALPVSTFCSARILLTRRLAQRQISLKYLLVVSSVVTLLLRTACFGFVFAARRLAQHKIVL